MSNLDRRAFLQAVLAGTLTACAPRYQLSPEAGPAAARRLTPAEWRTLAAAQERLLPRGPEGCPGAAAVHAIAWLDVALADPQTKPDDVAAIHAGAAHLGALGFADLPEAAQDAVLRRYTATPDGESWLILMLAFLFEALLGDPVHDVNPGQIGWAWLGVTVPFPRAEQS